MEQKLRWGVISSAGIAVRSVIPAILQSSRGVLTAIASRDQDKAQLTADKFGIEKAYGSYDELLQDPDIDAVYIPLPNHLHREWVIRAAEAGKHVLCEKPLALTAEESQEMIGVCTRAGVHLAEAYMYRHHPRMQRILDIIGEGEIGKVRFIRGAFTFNNANDRANIRYRSDWGGGSIYDVGCYPLSAARYILGEEPEAVTVHAYFSPEHDHVDMAASGLVEFSGGVALTFDCGMWADGRQTLEIVGTDGRIEIPYAFVTRPDTESFIVYAHGNRREEHVTSTDPYVIQVDDFARAAFGEQLPRFAPEDSIPNMRLIDACLRSARERTRISLK